MLHIPPGLGRNVLRGPDGLVRVERADVLGIAFRTCDGCGVDRHFRPGALLPALIAPLADREPNLELRAARPPFALAVAVIENQTAQGGQKLIVVETLPALLLQRSACLSHQRIRRGLDLE